MSAPAYVLAMRLGWISVAVLPALILAAPSQAKKAPVASFKLVSASGAKTQTFHEQTTHAGVASCTGTQSQSIRYRTTRPTKMYVTLREAHGLHTLVSDTPDPDSGLDYLSAPGEMTLSRSVDYQGEGCTSSDDEVPDDFGPVACPQTTFPNPVLVFGTHDPSAGLSPAYDTNVDLPPGLARECDPLFFPAPPRELLEFVGAIPRSALFGKKKRLSGEDSFATSYEETTGTGGGTQTTVSGTYDESTAVELKRLKRKK